jgi:predicted glutamine amidotransferase
MCQLLGMNGNVPTDICFSFDGFSARGGQTDEHADGWGIAFFEGFGCRVFLDVLPSHASPIADLVRKYPIKSRHIVAHIRKATQGSIALENCHPFQRELWGRYWVFAHNGTLHGFRPSNTDYYRAVGGTDSEAAFCYMLETLRRRFPDGEPPPTEVQACLAETADSIRRHGTFNFLLSDGLRLYAHRSTHLHYVLRQAPFAAAHLIDRDVTVDFSALATPNDKVAVIATTPLTDNEQWRPLEPERLAVFVDGALLEPTAATVAGG